MRYALKVMGASILATSVVPWTGSTPPPAISGVVCCLSSWGGDLRCRTPLTQYVGLVAETRVGAHKEGERPRRKEKQEGGWNI